MDRLERRPRRRAGPQRGPSPQQTTPRRTGLARIRGHPLTAHSATAGPAGAIEGAESTAGPATDHTQFTDIETVADIDRMVREFYCRMSAHYRLGPMFNHHAEVDWYEHASRGYASTTLWRIVRCQALPQARPGSAKKGNTPRRSSAFASLTRRVFSDGLEIHQYRT